MSGTRQGGKSAAVTNVKRYGANYYARIGAIGGKRSKTGGFASIKKGSDGLTGRERAVIVGSKGGMISRKGRNVEQDELRETVFGKLWK